MRIIPAIDIIGGKCVRLTKGDYSTKKVYSEDPLEVAKSFEDHGIRYLHLVDLDGAKSDRIINYRTLEKICSKTSLCVDFGGGIKSLSDIETAFACGAEQVTGGTVAALDRELFVSWIGHFGPEKIILGADNRNGKIYTRGWTEETTISTLRYIVDYSSMGIRSVICTDIERDGMLGGPAIELYKRIIEASGVKLIASGGISSLEDLKDIEEAGCDGAIIGKAIYEGKITLKELERLCLKKE